MSVDYDPALEADAYYCRKEQQWEELKRNSTCKDCAACRDPDNDLTASNPDGISWCEVHKMFVYSTDPVMDCDEFNVY